MNKTKNIFLTTVSETKDRLDILYFAKEGADGNITCTTGISVAEAGIKYILSKYKIDEIIVLGSPAAVGANEPGERVIADVPIDNITDLDGMSEYGFLCYRLKEYMDQIDFEQLDIGEAIPGAEQQELMTVISEFRNKYVPDARLSELFVKFSTDEELAGAFDREILSDWNPEQRKWLKHQVFSQMDSYYMIHMLPENRDTTIRFFPVQIQGAIDIGPLTDIVRETLSGQDEDVNLFMDIQGFNAVDGNTLISTFLMLNKRIGFNCQVNELIKSEHDSSCFCGRIWDVIKSYEIQKLISGIDIFLNYGKDNELKQYWSTLMTDDPDANLLFAGMDMVDEGITLCNIDLIACGIDVIRKMIRRPEEGRSVYLDIIVNAIKADYGKMLDGDSLEIPELLKWSLRKGLYQQTLTIIESKVPEDMIRRGIYYYAQHEGDIKKMMRAFNVIYWNEPARMRYSFNDLEHYFIKFYGRFALDYRQKPDAVARDYAQLRVDLLNGPQGDIPRAFSNLRDRELLFELLYNYYTIGNLRNQVNHASVDRAAIVADETVERKDIRIDLHTALDKFIKLYDTACRKTKENDQKAGDRLRKPAILEPRRFRGYARHHELQPLETPTDLTQANNYVCQFDGKDVLIRINMLKPEADEGEDEE